MRLEQLHPLLAEALDVHGAPAGEVGDGAGHPGRARLVGAAVVGLALGRTSGVPHTGQSVGNTHSASPVGPLGQHRADHLGDHVAGLAHDDRVARAHVLGRRPGPGCGGWPGPTVLPADEDRLEQGERAWPGRCARCDT